MALQSPPATAPVSSFPIFSPPPPPANLRPPSEIRFSRWNNANARDLVHSHRRQQDIEDDIRRERRFRSAIAISEDDAASSPPPTPRWDFKSVGTPSAPSRSSIPGRKSKYSKSPSRENPMHPAFRRISRSLNSAKVENPENRGFRGISRDFDSPKVAPEISVGDSGVAYRVPNAPFEFQYSYTETPKVRPLKLRGPAVTPFGPVTMPRPWTGRKPLPGSKKQLPEFDSFRLPPPYKKGVKPVQAPGPFVAGSGPKHTMSREEILGEPLTEEEIKDLIRGCLKTRRQLNMGRDGFTHNMLDNIHAHWKRRRVCKIRCKGVCTVDMDNVRQQLEEKTGGEVIYSRGGVIFLFRGRNYNYRTRPKFPLMLWKPATPVYPRLIEQVPEGMTLEEATEMRSRGRKLPPICKLGKNGVYCKLVDHVREAFEECDLVRINCKGMNKSDYKKIGAKLKDLVPCVLISFEHEHILMWRGREWNSSLPKAEDSYKDLSDCAVDSSASSFFKNLDNLLDSQETLDTDGMSSSVVDGASIVLRPDMGISNEDVLLEPEEDLPRIGKEIRLLETTHGETNEVALMDQGRPDTLSVLSEISTGECVHTSIQASKSCTEGVLLLLRQAIESGRALVLEHNDFMDANVVYRSSVDFAKKAPPGPAFVQRIRKLSVRRSEEQEKHTEGTDLEVVVPLVNTSTGEQKHSARRHRKDDLSGASAYAVPNGSLGVDELAKLLT